MLSFILFQTSYKFVLICGRNEISERLPIPETHPTNPLCSYGITKLTIEKYLALYRNLYNLDYTILRLGNPFGERQRIENVQGVITVKEGIQRTWECLNRQR
ncbi:MAG: NAD-dependent epimerase/dehydratase family protein [Acidobacteria bacterium]|nr:NAD-dependent epimerase/dehydratase family protein [Acidobacteriota bacterium]